MMRFTKFMQLGLLTFAVLFVGCAKERNEEMVQGQGENLNAISDYQGKIFEIETGEALNSLAASHTDALNIAENFTAINSYDLVELKVSHELIKDVPFRGKKNFKYKIAFEVNDQFLTIFKLAKKEDLPSQELTYAKAYGENLLAVPLVGYPVSLIKIDNILDGNGDKTHKKSEFQTKELSSATHFRYDLAGRQIFESIAKQDVFPADLFEGQWFYAATIVSANTKFSTDVGQNVGVDFEAKDVSRIRFIKTKDTLRAVNLNIDSNVDTSDDINFETALELPVQWVDYRIGKVGKGGPLKEEKLTDNQSESKNWSKRKYLEIDFAKVKSLVTQNNSGKFYNLEISNDYISFTIYYPSEQNRIKYSLRRASRPLKGRVYRKVDRGLFGFFTTEREYIKNWKYYRIEKQEEQVFLNRFYPQDNKIIYHFSSTTPPNMRQAGRRSIQSWNEGFAKAGTGIQLILDESKDVALGDIRYNIINIIDTKNGASLLGYGPSIVDSESGEIISATSNIYANPFREGLIGTVRNYIRSELGLFAGKYLSTNVNLKENIIPSNITALFNNANILSQDKNKDKKELNSNLELLNRSLISFKEEMKRPNTEHDSFGDKCSFETTYKDAVTKIKKNCPEINDYIKELKTANVNHNENELKYVEGCAEKLLEEQVVATLVHEMGHNLGLRHNFAASSDPQNFTYKEENGKQIAVALTSSVMDYQTNDVDELLAPGSYDVAAIKFGYANKVELNNKTDFSLDINKSVASQIDIESLRKYRFCTDEDVNKKDPLCQRHDQGINPKEIVQNLINEFNSILAINGHRYDRAEGTFPSRINMYITDRILFPLKTIYDHWRYYLMDFVTSRKGYLHTFNEKQMNQILEEMKQDKGRHGKHYLEYYEASNLAFQFLKELIQLPIKFCIVEKNNGDTKQIEALEFEVLRRDIFKELGVTINSCNQTETISFLTSNKMTLIKEVGNYHTDQVKTLDISGIDDATIIGRRKLINFEHIGLEQIRLNAMLILTIRMPTLELHAREYFVPNFIDDPRYRNEIFNFLGHRTLDGLSEQNLGLEKSPAVGNSATEVLNAESAAIASKKDKYFKKFQAEKDLLEDFIQLFVHGLYVPGKIEATIEKRSEISKITTQDPKVIPEGYAITRIDDNLVAANPNLFMGKLIALRNQLKMYKTLSEKKFPIPSEAEINELAFELKIPTLEKARKMPFKDFAAMIQGISELVEKSSPEMQIFLGKFFELELKFAEFLVQNQSKLENLMDTNTQEALATVTPNADKIIEAITVEAIPAKYKDASKQAKILNDRLEDYRIQVLDYEAQLDLLTKILISL